MTKPGHDVERLWDDRVPARPQSIEYRYPAPPVLSAAGRLDRRNAEHFLAEMRQVGRSIELEAARTLQTYLREQAKLEADSRLLSDIKWQLHRAKKESQILGAGDPEMEAKLGILDDEYFHRRRHQAFEAFED